MSPRNRLHGSPFCCFNSQRRLHFGKRQCGGPDDQNVHLGAVLQGPPVAADQFDGAVVFVEEWGIHCGPCLAQVPHIVQLQDELADFGLVIVAQHRQKATDDEVQSTARLAASTTR